MARKVESEQVSSKWQHSVKLNLVTSPHRLALLSFWSCLCWKIKRKVFWKMVLNQPFHSVNISMCIISPFPTLSRLFASHLASICVGYEATWCSLYLIVLNHWLYCVIISLQQRWIRCFSLSLQLLGVQWHQLWRMVRAGRPPEARSWAFCRWGVQELKDTIFQSSLCFPFNNVTLRGPINKHFITSLLSVCFWVLLFCEFSIINIIWYHEYNMKKKIYTIFIYYNNKNSRLTM